jgi:hypothetical protein
VNGRNLLALGCVVTLAVMLGIIGAAVVLTGGLAMLQPTTANRAAPTRATVFTQQAKPTQGRIFDPSGGVTMGVDQDVVAAIEQATKRQAIGEVRTFIDGGRAFFLPNGTIVQVIEPDGHMTRIQVMEGQHKNRVGWVVTNAVSI